MGRAARFPGVKSSGRGWAALVGFFLLLTGGGLVQAHPQFALSTVNRYGKLVLQGPRQTRIFFTLMVGDVPALALRQQADRNGDGTLDDGEQQGLAALLLKRVASGVHVYRGAAELTLPWEAAPLHLDSPAVAATAFACETTATLPPAAAGNGGVDAAAASGQIDELRYDDRVELPPAGEIELRVEEGPGMRVVDVKTSVAPAASGGAAPQPLLFQWSGPPRSSVSDRSVRVRFVAGSMPTSVARRPPGYQRHWPWLLGAVVMAGAAGAGLSRRRRENLPP